MGRFYKAAPRAFVEDKMFEIPFQEMAQVMGKVDKDIEKNEDEVLALQDTLKLQALAADSKDAKAKIKSYEDKIGNLIQSIYDDPLKYRAKTGDIRNLSRTIQKDFESGEAFNIQSNYDIRQKNLADLQAAAQKNPEDYNYEDIDKLMEINDFNYKGHKAGAYNTNMLKAFQDIDDVEELAKGYKPESSETLDAFERDGKLYTSKNSKEEVSPELIRQDILLNLQQDDKLNDYYGQQIELGNITADEYLTKQEETADRLAEKYGYTKTSKGLTSIKNDARATAQFVHDLENPLTNTTPGSIYDDPLLGKYAGVNPDGTPAPINNSLEGIDNAVQTIEQSQLLTSKTLTTLLGDNSIVINDVMAKGIAEGDFSVLKGVKSPVTGLPLSNSILLQEQKKYDALEFDKKILNKKKEVAINMAKNSSEYENADDYLVKNSELTIINTTADFQTHNIVNKNQVAGFNKQIKVWREELHNSRGWYGEPLKFDAKQLKGLPSTLQDKLKDGTSIQDLINDGTIKIKTSGNTGNPVTNALLAEKGIYVESNLKGSDAYQNFSVNGESAKPTLGLDGSGHATTQFEVSIDGNPIRVYMKETALSNESISNYMDKRVMRAAHKYNEALSEGVINEDDFHIDGVNFTKRGGQNFVNGATTTLGEAFQKMATKYKNDEIKMLE